MIKTKLRKVFYRVWEECENCSGKMITTSTDTGYYGGQYPATCEDCQTERKFSGESPRIVEDFEEIDE